MNHESITPIQSFEVGGKRYTLTHSAGSDAAFDSLRDGIDYHERERILKKVRHLETSGAPPSFVSNTAVQLQEQYVKANSDLWRVDQLLNFARTHQGLPYLLLVASPEIESFEQAKEVVSKLDGFEIGNVVQKCMTAAGVLKEKNLSGPSNQNEAQTGQNSPTDSSSTAS